MADVVMLGALIKFTKWVELMHGRGILNNP